MPEAEGGSGLVASPRQGQHVSGVIGPASDMHIFKGFHSTACQKMSMWCPDEKQIKCLQAARNYETLGQQMFSVKKLYETKYLRDCIRIFNLMKII